MATSPTDPLLRFIRQLADSQRYQILSDRELLRLYATEHDEAAFAVLVQRYGPRLLRICRRVLHSHHDAEDICQAAFLVLARKAGSRRWQARIGYWLYKVAYRLALDAKEAVTRQRTGESQATVPPHVADPAKEMCLRDAAAALNEELARLPDRLRLPVVLCHLEGQTRDQAAQQLGWSLRTLQRRLARALKLLRVRLDRRGIGLSTALVTVGLMEGNAVAAIPVLWIGATVRAAVLFASHKSSGGTEAVSRAALLAKGVLQMMAFAKVKWGSLLVVGLLALGAGAMVAHQALGGKTKEAQQQVNVTKPAAEKPSQPVSHEEAPRVDLYGDPLPPAALARLGTVRFRPCGELITFTPDGKKLIAAGSGMFTKEGSLETLSLWDRDSGKLLCRFGNIPNLCNLAVSSNRRIVAGWQAISSNILPGAQKDILYLWETATGKLLHQFKGSRRPYAISADGQLLAADLEGKIGLWEITTGKLLWKLNLKGKDNLDAVAFSDDSKALATAESQGDTKSEVRLWEVRTGRLLRTWESDFNGRKINHIVFSLDGNRLVVQTGPKNPPITNSVHLLDRIIGKVRPLGENSDGMVCSPNGTVVATYNKSKGDLCLWEMASGKEIRHLSNFVQYGGGQAPLSFSPDGKILAGTVGTTVKVGSPGPIGFVGGPPPKVEGIALWDVASGRELRRCQNSSQTMQGNLIFSPDGKFLVGQEGPSIQCWEVASGKKLSPSRECPDVISSVGFSPDGKSLVSLETKQLQGCQIYSWDPQSGQQRSVFPSNTTEFSSTVMNFDFSPTGKVLAFGLGTGPNPNEANMCIDIWEAASGRKLQTLEMPKEANFGGMSSAISPDGKFLGCSLISFKPNAPNAINTCIWELATGKLLRHRFPGLGPVFSPDNVIVATQEPETSRDKPNVCYLWDLSTGKKLAEFKTRPSGYPVPVFSPDGQALLESEKYMTDKKIKTKIQLYPLYRDKQVGLRLVSPRTLLDINGEIGSFELSPDGKLLTATYPDDVNGTVYLWETATGKERCRFQGHNDRIASLSFSPDGRRLASASFDTTILVWDITGRLDNQGRLRAASLSAKEMQERWTDLTDANAARAHQSLWTLVAAGQSTVTFLAMQLRPTPHVATAILNQLIADLGSETFTVRQKAQQQLEAVGEIAEPSLRQALEKWPSLELKRRVDHLLELIEEQRARPSCEMPRTLRAIEVLEHLDTPEARQLLKTLSSGAPGARQTKEAKAALARLARRTARL